MVVASDFGDTGAYSVYTFVSATYMVPYAVLAVPIAMTVSPHLSEATTLPGRPSLTSLTARSTRLVLGVGVITVALPAVLASPVGLVFGILHPARGMDITMPVMTPGLAGYMLIYHGSHVFYVVEASHTVVFVNSLARLSVCAALGTSVATGIDERRQTLIAVGASVSVGMIIDAISQITATHRAVGKRTTAGMIRSTPIAGAASAMGAASGHVVVKLVLGMSGTDGIGAFISATAGGIVVLSAGKDAVLLFNRDVLRLARGAKEPGVEGSRAERPDVEGPTSDGAGTQ